MIITKTPLRISFFGGGTDFPDYFERNGGAVVSAGINKYIYICLNKKFDNKIRVSYSQTEIADDVEALQHDIVRECIKLVGVTGGIEIVSIADIPSGTGLGSSSAFTVGVLNALHTYVGHSLSAEDLASQACKVEIDELKRPIGKQDQYAAAYGGTNFFQFNADGSVDRERIFLDDVNARAMRQKLMLFYTGISRDANTILQEQRNMIPDRVNTLDEMKEQAYAMFNELKKDGFMENFGKSLGNGWQQKRSLTSTISNDNIDKYYDKAIKSGALGGKLLGAGGGGFLLFYCDENKQAAVEDAVGLERVDFHVSRYGSRVVFFA